MRRAPAKAAALVLLLAFVGLDPAYAVAYLEPTTAPDGAPLTPGGRTLQQCVAFAPGRTPKWIPASSPLGGARVDLSSYLGAVGPDPLPLAVGCIFGPVSTWGRAATGRVVVTLESP